MAAAFQYLGAANMSLLGHVRNVLDITC
jgi:hypothetical protein